MIFLKKKHIVLSLILLCLGSFVLLFQNCGKAGESASGSSESSSSASTMVHYFVPLVNKVVMHGVTGEIASERPSIPNAYEETIGIIGDVGGSDGASQPDGIEDYIVYVSKSTFTSTERTSSNRKFLVRSGRDGSVLVEKAFTDFTVPSSLQLSQTVHLLDDVDDDGVKDILAFTSRNRFENPSNFFLTTSEIRIFSGANLMQIKLANITDTTGQNEYTFLSHTHVFQNSNKDLIFYVRANYNFLGFQFFDISTTNTIFYDLSFNSAAGGAQVLYDYNEDGKADYTYYDFQSKKMYINSFVLGQEIPDIDFQSFEVPDQWSNFYPDLIDWDGDSVPEILMTFSRDVGTSFTMEFSYGIYSLRDLTTPMAIFMPPPGKYFWYVNLVSDINRDGKKDAIVLQKSRQDVTGRIEKVAIYSATNGLNLYEVRPTRETNSNYSSIYSHVLVRYLGQ